MSSIPYLNELDRAQRAYDAQEPRDELERPEGLPEQIADWLHAIEIPAGPKRELMAACRLQSFICYTIDQLDLHDDDFEVVRRLVGGKRR